MSRRINVTRIELSSNKKLSELCLKGGNEDFNQNEDGPIISPLMLPLNAIAIGKDGRKYKISVHTKDKLWIPTESKEEYKLRLQDMAKQHLNQPDGFNQLAEKIVGKNHLTKWGSIKYDGAFMTFKMMQILDKYFDDPLAFLNINYSLAKPEKKQDVVNKFGSFIFSILKDNDAEEKLLDKANKLKSIDVGLKLIKSYSNLWKPIKKLFNLVYQDGKINAPKGRRGSPDLDPDQQESNNFVGIVAYLLVKNGYIKNDNIFEHFEG